MNGTYSRIFLHTGPKHRKINKNNDGGIWEKYVKLGSKFKCEIDCTIHPTIKNVGFVEKRTNGRPYYTIYPGHSINRKLLHHNIKVKKGQDNWNKLIPSQIATGRISRIVHAYLKGMPSPAEEVTKISSYYFENGHRKVHPYYVVHDEYFSNPPRPGCETVRGYFKAALGEIPEEWMEFRVRKGLVFVNFQPIDSLDHPLRNGDYLTSLAHYHERPVLDQPIDVLHEDHEMIVVNKPASMVIYPAVGYRLNSLIYILAEERGLRCLKPVHRLDKLTSGVLILAKCNEHTGTPKLQQRFRDGSKKEYVALVDGDFPEESIRFDRSIGRYAANLGKFKEFRTGPKESATVFHKLKGFGDHSLVRCCPEQGRTHQIRIHLKELGYPIVNDTMYNPYDISRHENTLNKLAREGMRRVMAKDSDENCTKSDAKDWETRLSENLGNPSGLCHDCELGDELHKWRDEDLKFICLHSWIYTLDGKTFEAPWPRWAMDEDFRKDLMAERLKPLEKLPYL